MCRSCCIYRSWVGYNGYIWRIRIMQKFKDRWIPNGLFRCGVLLTYAALYGITEKKVGKLLDKGLFFSIKYIDDQPRKGIRASIKPKRKRGLLYKMSAESEWGYWYRRIRKCSLFAFMTMHSTETINIMRYNKLIQKQLCYKPAPKMCYTEK